MTLSKYKDLDLINNKSLIDDELLILKKRLLELRMKKAALQVVKPHLFKDAKRRIAQLNFKKSGLDPLKKN